MKLFQLQKNKGLTLLELVIAIFILSIIISVFWGIIRNMFTAGPIFTDNLNAQQEARVAFKMMTRETRSLLSASTGAYPIAQAGTSTVTFYGNVDTDSYRERIRYFISGTTLKRGVIKPTGNPLTYVSGNEVVTDVIKNINNGTTSIFDYYDTNYDGTSAPLVDPVDVTSVRLIKMTFIIDRDPNKLPSPFRISTQVSLRNLKDNL